MIKNIKEGDIIKVTVTDIKPYGAFVRTDKQYDGIIHISEISYSFVKNITDYLNIGDEIYAKVMEFLPNKNRINFSIKDLDYRNDGSKLFVLNENINGFKPLQDNLDIWINQKIKEITDKF